jgi:predicted ArsR family transcriptional regulator
MARRSSATAAQEKPNSSEQIRARLLSGEPVAVPQLAEEFGVTKGLVTAVLSKFRQQGYTISTESKSYNGRRMKHYSVKETTSRPKRAAKRVAKPAETPLTPTLGQNLIVTLLALGDQGELRLGLKNGDTTYVCTLDRVN